MVNADIARRVQCDRDLTGTTSDVDALSISKVLDASCGSLESLMLSTAMAMAMAMLRMLVEMKREKKSMREDEKKNSGGIDPTPPSTRRNPDLNFHLDCFTGGANLTTRALGSATKHSATESPKRRLGRTAIHSS